MNPAGSLYKYMSDESRPALSTSDPGVYGDTVKLVLNTVCLSISDCADPRNDHLCI